MGMKMMRFAQNVSSIFLQRKGLVKKKVLIFG